MNEAGVCPRRDACPWGRRAGSRGVRPGGLRSPRLAGADTSAVPSAVLVAASHGTSCCAGDGAVRALVTAVIAAADAEVAQAFVDVQQPDVPSVLDDLAPGQRAVIVPLLLSAGYHVHVDLMRAASAPTVRVADALGPDDALVQLLVQRLDEAGIDDADAIVLAAAGSSDAAAVADCRDVAARLERAVGRPVTVGFLSAARPTLPEAIVGARTAHPGARVAVSTYLLAPGYFAELVFAAGADVVAEPLLVADGPAPDQLVRIVLQRYASASLTSH